MDVAHSFAQDDKKYKELEYNKEETKKKIAEIFDEKDVEIENSIDKMLNYNFKPFQPKKYPFPNKVYEKQGMLEFAKNDSSWLRVYKFSIFHERNINNKKK